MLAHELRNPLATIRNGLKIWERGSADKASEIARVAAQRQLDHEIRLVEDLLDVSRITRGIITLKIEQIDLIETVRRTVEAMRSEIDLHQHELSLALPTDALTVNADAMRIEQVVTNLLGNALKYTPAGGQIRISLERDGNEAVLSVVDNGIGMAADLIPTIFEIFVQAERSLDGKSAGLGLGLALVSRLVELHRGRCVRLVKALSTAVNLWFGFPHWREAHSRRSGEEGRRFAAERRTTDSGGRRQRGFSGKQCLPLTARWTRSTGCSRRPNSATERARFPSRRGPP